MSLDVLQLAQQLRRSEAEVRSQLTVPVLVLVAEAQPGEVLVFTTRTLHSAPVGPSPRPTAWLLRKDTVKPNPFTMGITVGRVAGNDVVLAHSSISRLHAYFVPGKRGQWRLFDANSKNGTWVGEQRLPPNIPSSPTEGEPVPDGASLRLGHLLLRFFTPDAFVAYLRGLREDGA
jgi:hypothetical protein